MTSDNRTSERPRSNIAAALFLLVSALMGPGLSLVLWGSALAFAPPWTFLTGMIYPLLICGGFPLVILAVAAMRRRAREGFAFLGLTLVAAVLVLTMVGPDVPGGDTSCQPLVASPPQARYACVSFYDDSNQRRLEFTLEGWTNWPVMRMVDLKQYK